MSLPARAKSPSVPLLSYERLPESMANVEAANDIGLRSESELRVLAATDPDALHRRVLSGSLSPGLCARALEALGAREDSDRFLGTIVNFLGHPKIVLQEAAIYALGTRADEDDSIRDVLRQKSADPSTHHIIREILESVLEG